MKKHSLILAAAFLMCSLLTACRGDEPKRIPDTLPDVRGYIAQIKKTTAKQDKSKAVIMVKSIEGVDAKFPEASIELDKSTLIESASGEYLHLEQLREGQEVEAWFEGDIVETVPVQGYVKAVRVQTQ